MVGSVNLDIVVRADRLPAAGETVMGEAVVRTPGGKGANQAVAAARAGAATELIAAVGHDEVGTELVTFLGEAGVGTAGVARVDRPTGAAVVTVAADGANAIVVVPGANSDLAPAHVSGVCQPGDILVTQLEIPLGTVAEALTGARRAGAVTVLNLSPAHPEAPAALPLADVVVVNDTELTMVEDVLADGTVLVVTRGARGAEVRRGDTLVVVPTPRVRPVDTTGAGDCLLGVMAAWLADGAPLERAVRAGCVAGSIQVTRPGAALAMPGGAEIRDVLRRADGGGPS